MGELRAGQEGSEGEGDVGDDVQDDPGFGGVLHFEGTVRADAIAAADDAED